MPNGDYNYSTVTLNIGLEDNKLMGKRNAQQIADWLVAFLSDCANQSGFRPDTVVAVQIAEPQASNVTELTAVVQYSAEDVTRAGLTRALERLTALTNQGCIAALIEADEGEALSVGLLVGPRSSDYAPFNPGRFEIGDANAAGWAFSRLHDEPKAAALAR